MGAAGEHFGEDGAAPGEVGAGVGVGAGVVGHPHPVRGGKQPRILFGTQASTRPPTFVLFTTGFLDPQYRRFITRRLREIYGFEGSPINVNMRVRERRKRT